MRMDDIKEGSGEDEEVEEEGDSATTDWEC